MNVFRDSRTCDVRVGEASHVAVWAHALGATAPITRNRPHSSDPYRRVITTESSVRIGPDVELFVYRTVTEPVADAGERS